MTNNLFIEMTKEEYNSVKGELENFEGRVKELNDFEALTSEINARMS